MNIKLILIGNELLNGKIKDLNTHTLAKFCRKHHLTLAKVEIVPDDEDSLRHAISNESKHFDIILTSGGLGPTLDDKTKNILATTFNKEIVFNQQAQDIALSHYQRTNREFNADKIKYGHIPTDFQALYNPTGYAPGLFYSLGDDKFIAALPGVPSEFESMLNESIKPHIKTSNFLRKQITIKTQKVPEAVIFHKLCPELWNELERFGEVSSLPHYGGVDIGVIIESQSQSELEKKEKEILSLIHNSAVKEHIWHIGPQSIEEVIIDSAKKKGLTFAFAESCTGGLLSHRITNIAGSSAVLLGGVVSYANEVKEKTLHVQHSTLSTTGAVSIETAKEMAQGLLKVTGADITISTTGIAGPGGGSEEKPVGCVCIGWATKDQSNATKYQFKGNREDLKMRFSQYALFELLNKINHY